MNIKPNVESDRVIGPVSVGRGTYSCAEFLTYLADERIEIGRYCSIATAVTIAAGGQHESNWPSTWPFDNLLLGRPNPTRTYKRSPTTRIGSDVWIGHGAHIGGGVTIGDGAIVGAKAVVFSDVPPYAIVVGNPAKLLRRRFHEEEIAAMLRIRWWDWSPKRIRENHEWFYRPIAEFIASFDA